MESIPHLGELTALCTALLWTLCAMAFSEAGRRVGSLSVNVIRLCMAGLMYVVYGALVRGLPFPTDADPTAWKYLGLSGLVGFFIGDLALMRAFVLIGPRLGMLIFSLAPPITAMLAAGFLGERLTWLDWIGMATVLGGVGWVVAERRAPSVWLAQTRRELMKGAGLAFIGAFCQALGLVLGKKGMGSYDPFASSQIRLLVALPAFLLLALVLRRGPRLVAACRDRRVMALLLGGAFTGPFLGVGLALFSMQHAPAGVVSTLLSLPPILILPLSYLFYREAITLRAVVGAAVAVGGVVLLVW